MCVSSTGPKRDRSLVVVVVVVVVVIIVVVVVVVVVAVAVAVAVVPAYGHESVPSVSQKRSRRAGETSAAT